MGEKHSCVRKALIGCLSNVPWLGTGPSTQACALTGNRTGDLLLYGTTFNQLGHAGQGPTPILLEAKGNVYKGPGTDRHSALIITVVILKKFIFY